jgi:sugar/nucleoside kinase (ribokinase family)
MTAEKRFDVTIAGDCNLDLLLYGLPEDLPHERELLASGMDLQTGGSAAITACNLAALGNSVGFVCATAEDAFAPLCLSPLIAAGVDTSATVKIPQGASGVTVHVQHQESRHMLTYAGVTHGLTRAHLDVDYLARSRHFHMASYYLQQGLTPDIPALLAELKQRGLTISMDPNDDPEDRWDRAILEALRYVDVLMPNEREACRVADVEDPEEAIAMLRTMVPLLVVKRGALGATAYTRDARWETLAHPVQTVDAVGAGDSFNAGFLHGYLRQWTIDRCLRFGCLAGAWSTTASGGTAAFADPASRAAFDETWQSMETAALAQYAKFQGTKN